MKYFGTDGIRGIYGNSLTDMLAFKVGYAISKLNPAKVVIGRDTRPSGESLFRALSYGLCLGGVKITDVKICSTPCLAHLTEVGDFDYGIMITASHCSVEYNGIKVFNSIGEKLFPEDEQKLEELIDSNNVANLEIENLDRLLKLKSFSCSKMAMVDSRISKNQLVINTKLIDTYIKFLISDINITKPFKIAVDTANGACYDIAKRVLDKVNLNGVVIHSSLDEDINAGCGALYPEDMQKLVKEEKLDLGICVDGDADRCVFVQDDGTVLNGEDLIYILATYLKSIKKLANNTAVFTILNNSALEIELNKQGIQTVRSGVGDKKIYEEMVKNGYNFGGENCGHIIFKDKSRSGDGLYCGLKLLELIENVGLPLSKIPKLKLKGTHTINYRCDDKQKIMSNQKLLEEKDRLNKKIAKDGRIILRPSGTENLVRILVEHSSVKEAKNIANNLLAIIEAIK